LQVGKASEASQFHRSAGALFLTAVNDEHFGSGASVGEDAFHSTADSCQAIHLPGEVQSHLPRGAV
jgi:hypothetical protein